MEPAFVAQLDTTGIAQLDVPSNTLKAVVPVAGGRVLRVATIFRRHVAPTSYAARMGRLLPEVGPGDHGVVGVGSTYLAVRDATNEVVVLGSLQAFAHGTELQPTAHPTFEQGALVRGASVSGTRLSMSESQMNAPLSAFVSVALAAVPSTRAALLAATRND